MLRTFDEVNEKIRAGRAVVMTAEEVVKLVQEEGVKAALPKVDVVTCATFGAMCSSGAFVNFGHADPPIRMGKIWLNDVEVYGGLAAVDTYVGATQPSEKKGIAYGGAHVIEDLIAGKPVHLRAESGGTDCYPRTEVETDLTLDELNQAYLYNPRNCYQNYSAATNASDKTIHTYMGTLLPGCANVTYSTSGELSPLLKDPNMRTIGMGTRIFLAGAQGYVAWEGTQFNRGHEEGYEGGVNDSGATLALIGDMKQMNARYLRGASMKGYGVTMYVGVGFAMPVLDEDLLHDLARPNSQLYTCVYDYSSGSRKKPMLRRVSYAELRSGKIELNGRMVNTAPLSSLLFAREIAAIVKESVSRGEFLLQEPIARFDPATPFKPLKGGAVLK
ncbi:MAG: homocysteine biosynthesis protein [Eubacteriales bacterium]|nr:homocysteine biosynthesis protein [Eubacteriales bacterium]